MLMDVETLDPREPPCLLDSALVVVQHRQVGQHHGFDPAVADLAVRLQGLLVEAPRLRCLALHRSDPREAAQCRDFPSTIPQFPVQGQFLLAEPTRLRAVAARQGESGQVRERERDPGAVPGLVPKRQRLRVQPSRLSDKAVALIVKRRAKAVGLDPTRYAGHSLRAGLATSAAAAGASERVIMSQTGHRSADMVRKYIREGSLFTSNASALVGL